MCLKDLSWKVCNLLSCSLPERVLYYGNLRNTSVVSLVLTMMGLGFVCSAGVPKYPWKLGLIFQLTLHDLRDSFQRSQSCALKDRAVRLGAGRT